MLQLSQEIKLKFNDTLKCACRSVLLWGKLRVARLTLDTGCFIVYKSGLRHEYAQLLQVRLPVPPACARCSRRVCTDSYLLVRRAPQAEADRYYHDEIPWPDDWEDPEDERGIESEGSPRKRRSPRKHASPSNKAGPSRLKGRRSSLVKAENTQSEPTESDSTESVEHIWEEQEEDGEMILVSTPVSLKGKGRAAAGEGQDTSQRRSESSHQTAVELE